MSGDKKKNPPYGEIRHRRFEQKPLDPAIRIFDIDMKNTPKPHIYNPSDPRVYGMLSNDVSMIEQDYVTHGDGSPIPDEYRDWWYFIRWHENQKRGSDDEIILGIKDKYTLMNIVFERYGVKVFVLSSNNTFLGYQEAPAEVALTSWVEC